MALDVLGNGLRAKSYHDRAKLLHKLLHSESEADAEAEESLIIDCAMGIPTLARKIFENVPSFTELVVCNMGCTSKEIHRAVPVIETAALCANRLDVISILELPRLPVCDTPQCEGSTSTALSAIGEPIF